VKTLGTEVGLALYKKWAKITQQAGFLQKNLKRSSWKPVGRNIGKLIILTIGDKHATHDKKLAEYETLPSHIRA